MKSQIRIGLILFFLFTLLTGLVYPLAITLIAQGAFPHRANGSVMERQGQPIGSELIGQPFDDPRYFWGRPSATEKVPYNAASSSGSNLGPTNPDLLKSVKERICSIARSASKGYGQRDSSINPLLARRVRTEWRSGSSGEPGGGTGRQPVSSAFKNARVGVRVRLFLGFGFFQIRLTIRNYLESDLKTKILLIRTVKWLPITDP